MPAYFRIYLLVSVMLGGCTAQAPTPSHPRADHGNPAQPIIEAQPPSTEHKPASDTDAAHRTVQVVKPWGDSKCKCLLRGRDTASEVECKRTMCEIKSGEVVVNSIPMNAFISPITGHAWVGLEQSIYIDMDYGIVGVQMMAWDICWSKSLAPETATINRDNVSKRDKVCSSVESSLTIEIVRDSLSLHGNEPVSHLPRRTAILGIIDTINFLGSRPYRSDIGNINLLSISRDEELLKFDMTNMSGEIHATIWIDPKTRSGVKGIRDEYPPK